MKILIASIVLLCVTSCVSVLDREKGEREWIIYPGNPVIELGAQDEWDSWALASPNVLKVGETCHMYYEAGAKGVIDYQIGHAVSKDGVNWVKDLANPVIPFGESGEWDDKETWDPFVIHEDGIFKMWYGGTTFTDGKRDFQIGYATSRDGTHFTRKGQISHYERGNIGDMHVVHDAQSGKYYMYYLDRSYKPDVLLRAESPNETDFDFENAKIIEVPGEEKGYRCPHVIIDDGIWYMYYGYKYKDRAGYATSPDGLHWTPQNTNVIKGHDPEILKMANDLYLLFYCPTEYDMGHKQGSDIRVAVFKGHLNDLASTEPTP